MRAAWLCLLGVLAGCDEPGSAGLDDRGAPGGWRGDDDVLGGPPPGATRAWQGAWWAGLAMRDPAPADPPPVALDVRGNLARVFDGKRERAMTLWLDSPCTVAFVELGEPGVVRRRYQAVIDHGVLRVGAGSVGYRRGGAAVVCSRELGVVTLDARGACQRWRAEGAGWIRDAAVRCAWSVHGGQDVLEVAADDAVVRLVADGDVLRNERDDPALHALRPMRGYARACAELTAAQRMPAQTKSRR